MPRFYFHLRDQGHLLEDPEGTDLPDLHAALDEVLRTERELCAEPAGFYGLEFEICDGSGRTMLRVPVQTHGMSRFLSPPANAQEGARSPELQKPYLH
jgi:hypothetical protein